MADLRICRNNFCARNVFFRKEGNDVASAPPRPITATDGLFALIISVNPSFIILI